MLGHPLRRFSLSAEGVSLCTMCVTGAVTPHPPGGGSLGTYGGGQFGLMSLKWRRGPMWSPHISGGPFKGFMSYLGLCQGNHHPIPGTYISFSFWRLFLGTSMATERIKRQDTPTCTSHFPLDRRTLRGEHNLCGDARAENTLYRRQESF